jgi:hypothetical protein
MSNEPIILAVDLDASGMKAALISIRVAVLGWESEPVKLIITSDGAFTPALILALGRMLVSVVVITRRKDPVFKA